MGKLKIERELIFQQNAFHGGNVKGRFSFANKIVFYDDFLGIAIDDTNDWAVAGVNGGDASITVPHCMTVTTGGADTDDVDVAGPIGFYGQYNACIEARFRIDDVLNTAVNIGFTDAVGYTADTIAFRRSGDTTTDNSLDGAVLLFDKSSNVDYLFFDSSKGGNNGTAVQATSVIAVKEKWYTMRIEFVDNGSTTNAMFYLNTDGKEIHPEDDFVGSELDAVTRDTALCPYIGFMNSGESATNTLDIDYIKVWQDRS